MKFQKLGRNFCFERSKDAMRALKELRKKTIASQEEVNFQDKLFAFFKYMEDGLDNDFFMFKDGFEYEVDRMITTPERFLLCYHPLAAVGRLNGDQRVPNCIGGTTYIEIWRDRLEIEITNSNMDMWTFGYTIYEDDDCRIVIDDDKS